MASASPVRFVWVCVCFFFFLKKKNKKKKQKTKKKKRRREISFTIFFLTFFLPFFLFSFFFFFFPLLQVLEVGILLGLMCKYSCEDCEFRVFSSNMPATVVKLRDGTILDNMDDVLALAANASANHCRLCGCERPETWDAYCDCPSCELGCEFPSPAEVTKITDK